MTSEIQVKLENFWFLCTKIKLDNSYIDDEIFIMLSLIPKKNAHKNGGFLQTPCF